MSLIFIISFRLSPFLGNQDEPVVIHMSTTSKTDYRLLKLMISLIVYNMSTSRTGQIDETSIIQLKLKFPNFKRKPLHCLKDLLVKSNLSKFSLSLVLSITRPVSYIGRKKDNILRL